MKKRKKLNQNALKRIIPLCIVLVLTFILYFGYKFIFKEKKNEITFLETIQTETYGNITKYAIYGIHMNVEGNITLTNKPSSIHLVLSNGTEEIILPWEITEHNQTYTFKTSEYINEGIVLEDLPVNTYYLLIKTTEEIDNETITKYYSIENDTEYDDLEYYTLTKHNKNNKIKIEWNTYEECPTLRFQIEESTLPEDVYDITIDPGHDASDPGKAVCKTSTSIYNPSGTNCYNGGTLYKESDINLAVSLALKETLEAHGYKVAMTRSTESDYVQIYEPMGSATMANDTKSKFSLAIHHNSSGVDGGINYLKGLEIYIANDTNLDFAELLVKYITEKASTTGSYKSLYKLTDGIYQRFFEESDIDNDYWTTDMIYYYYIREVGGISTHAAQNIERKGYSKNEHYNSNNTAEPYLFELGYIDNLQDLNNIINNKEGYAEGIVAALLEYLNTEKNS